jgi:uncharacterized protein (TIGR04206 family)
VTGRRRPVPRALPAALVALLVVPWSVQTYAGGPPTVLFAWGEVGLDPLSATTLSTYLANVGAPPEWLLGWPLALCCLLFALGAAVVGVARGRYDPAFSAGLLALAGVGLCSFAWGFSAQPGRTAVPVGAVGLWLVAARQYATLRRD